jgi:uncharacterized phage infection (PIP) family protein YhgE
MYNDGTAKQKSLRDLLGAYDMEENQNPNYSGAQSSREADAAGSAQDAGQTQSGPQSGPSAQQSQAGQELLDELTQLADKFASVVKTAWNSEQRKQVETDVRTGLSTMAASLEDGFKQVATSTEAKDLQTKATEVGEKVTSTKFFADLTGALTTGLRTLSDQLDKVAADMQTKNEQSAAAKPPAGAAPASPESEAPKDIPISKE